MSDAFYDSDEECACAWGPVTPRELRRQLKDYKATKFDRRRTVGYASPPKKKEEPPEIVIDDIKHLADDMSKLSTNSKYFTPNETMSTPKESSFINKVEEVLSEDSNSFTTACDKSMLVNRTGLALNALSEHVRGSCMIDNFHATLIEEEQEFSDDEDFKFTLNGIIKKLDGDIMNSNIDKSCILISDDDDESYQHIENIKNENDYDNDESFENINVEAQYNFTTAIKDISGVFDISPERKTCSPIDSQVCNPSDTIEKTGETSQDTIESNESFMFNDTLEEMKRALEYGVDYPESDKKPVPQSAPKKYSSISRLKPPSNYNTPNHDFKMPTKPVRQIPTPDLKSKTFSHIKSPVAHYIKNTGTAQLRKNIPGNSQLPRFTPKKLQVSPAAKQGVDNGSLPSRMYRPAKNNYVSKHIGPRIPGAIEKLVPSSGNIIRHDGRIGGVTITNVESKLLNNDNLTMCDDSTNDISMLVSRKAVIN